MFLSCGRPNDTTVPKSSFLATSSIDLLRDADRVGLSKGLQTRGDIDPVAEHIPILLHDVALMNADADVNLLGLVLLGVVGAELGLNRLRALHGMDDGGEFDQEGVAHRFDDLALMRQLTACWMSWLWMASSCSVRASSAPIWRLKPTMSVNMIAASRRCLSWHCAAGVIIHRYGLFG